VFEASTGHIGLSVSRSSHTDLWPAVADWYAERSRVEATGDESLTEDDDESLTEDADESLTEDADESLTEGDDESLTEGDDDAGLETIRGVGPSYADRLREAGVESIADLAAADPPSLAATLDLGEARVADWVSQARDRRS
jgi:polyhydroxyalkanoate synthase